MKQTLIQIAKNILNCNRLKKVSHFLFLGLLFCLVWLCFQIYPKWNEIPNQTIRAKITALGYTSDSSYCNFHIKVAAGNPYISVQDDKSTNTIYVYSSPKYTSQHTLDKNFLLKFTDTSVKHRDVLANMYTFYVLDYYCYTTIDVAFNNSESKSCPNPQAFSYIDSPQWGKDSFGSSYTGSGFLAFPDFEGKSGMIGEGNGKMEFNTNLINGKPNMKSLWDITQANYSISLGCDNISCDTISIEFYGATLFSNMYPEPDKTTMSGIEFTSPDKVNEIIKNGLRFHTEFLELKEMAAMRIFILTALLSLFIALIANAITKWLF